MMIDQLLTTMAYVVCSWLVATSIFLSVLVAIDAREVLYNENDNISMFIVFLLGPVNFIVYPYYRMYIRSQEHLDKMIEELEA